MGIGKGSEESKPEEEKNTTATTTPLHGDILQEVLGHLPTVDLLPALYVSATWQRAVYSSLRTSPRLRHHWLLLHASHARRRGNHSSTTYAYDPHSHVWITIPPHVPASSSDSKLLFHLNSSKLAVSSGPLRLTWQDLDPPRAWRRDPVMAAVGNYVVVAGGTCEFLDNPCAVEVYHRDFSSPEACEPMPEAFRGSASATWLSAAASDRKMYVVERSTGLFCSFDPVTRSWGRTADLRPDTAVFVSAIGFSGGRLILAAAAAGSVESLRLWEVDCESLGRKVIGSMPEEMLKTLNDDENLFSSPLSKIEISVEMDFAYIYNPSDPRVIFSCDFAGGDCKWRRIPNPVAGDGGDLMDRYAFTCTAVGIDDLRAVFRLPAATAK